jgi:hypothetical protein
MRSLVADYVGGELGKYKEMNRKVRIGLRHK